MSNNQYGLDSDYFEKELIKISEIVDHYAPEELVNALVSLANTANNNPNVKISYSTVSTTVAAPESNHRAVNVGNSDYATKNIQPWDIWLEYQLNPWDADIVKRTLRTKNEGGMTAEEARILDYEKIQHICQERINQIKNGNPWYREK